MKRGNWLTITAGLVLTSSVVVLPALASGENRAGRERGRGNHIRLMRVLELTDDQKQQLKSQREASREEMELARGRLLAANEALHDAVGSGADEFAIHALAADVGIAQGDAAVLRSRQIGELKALLTPEQLDKMTQLKAEREQRSEQRRQRRQQRRNDNNQNFAPGE